MPIHLPYAANTASFVDLNSDGIPDLVMTTVVNGHLSAWTLLADGHGGFAPTTPQPVLITTDESAPSSVTLTDLDGDGYPDLVLGGNQFGEIRFAMNDGSGTMRPPALPLPFVGSAYAGGGPLDAGNSYQVFADFNNSGQNGFVTVTPGGLDVYVGKGDGTFEHTDSLSSPFEGSAIVWLKVGDVNNDGIPDIVCGDKGTEMAVYLGNGDGTFRQAPYFSSPGRW